MPKPKRKNFARIHSVKLDQGAPAKRIRTCPACGTTHKKQVCPWCGGEGRA